MKANETTVVVPPKRAARVAPSGGCSHSSRPCDQPLCIGSWMCACGSTPPGKTSLPLASITRPASMSTRPGRRDVRDRLAADPDLELALLDGRDDVAAGDQQVDHVAPLRSRTAAARGRAQLRDPALVLGQVGVDRAVEVARAGRDRGAQLRLDLVGRAGEHEPLAQVRADAEPVGELDVLGLLLLARMAVALQVVGLADLEQRRLELLGDELVLDARVGEVQGERRRRPGAVRLRLARLLVDPPEAR